MSGVSMNILSILKSARCVPKETGHLLRHSNLHVPVVSCPFSPKCISLIGFVLSLHTFILNFRMCVATKKTKHCG